MSAILAIVKMLIAYALIIPQIINPFFYVPIGQEKYFEDWSADMEYTQDYAANLEKSPDKDFVVLNLADIQLSENEQFDTLGKESFDMITALIEDTQPDLITLSGDNAWGTITYDELVKFIDSFDIPWAPVMGNHDGQGCVSEFWCAYLFAEAENCLFKFGPKDMGYGNYVINITENGRIIHTFYMMDTHSNRDYTVGESTWNDYDHLWENQMEWYEWAVKGTNAIAGRNVESTVVIHIPVYEVKEVYNNNYNQENDKFTGIYALGAFGATHELPCPGGLNNGFLDLVVELGSTKNIIFGHDHVNSSSVVVDGVRLTYGLKLGKGCYYEDGMMGGTTLTINSFGKVATEHHYYG
ncbi:MAG: metallophosphoesterase [Clostridia bacterium]|nr:metallophosphoesterase [Clostridia bacterium]